MMRLAVWVFVGLLVASGARAQTLKPACGLMTQATAAAINGAPVSAGQEQDHPGDNNQCEFDGKGNNGTVTVEEDGPSATGISSADMFKMRETTPLQGMTVTVLSGIGDGAYFTQNGTIYDLWVLAGQNLLDVNATQPQGAISGLQAAMAAAAKTALTKM